MGQFDKLSERARKVLQLAHEESQRFNHNYIGTEHLLLGLVREGDGVAARVLNNMGVQLPKVRSSVEFIIGRGEGKRVGEVGLTPRAKKVLELAVDEGRRLKHHYIGTEHLLLGLVREGEGIAAGVLESLGVNLEKVRSNVMQVVAELSPDPAVPPPFRPVGYGPGVEWFSRRSLALLLRALDEAESLGYPELRTGHLVIALLQEDSSPTVTILDDLRLRIDEFRQTMQEISPLAAEAREPSGAMSAHARVVLERASYEARLRSPQVIEPEHILLATSHAAGSIAATLKELFGVDLEDLRRRTEEALALPADLES